MEAIVAFVLASISFLLLNLAYSAGRGILHLRKKSQETARLVAQRGLGEHPTDIGPDEFMHACRHFFKTHGLRLKPSAPALLEESWWTITEEEPGERAIKLHIFVGQQTEEVTSKTEITMRLRLILGAKTNVLEVRWAAWPETWSPLAEQIVNYTIDELRLALLARARVKNSNAQNLSGRPLQSHFAASHSGSTRTGSAPGIERRFIELDPIVSKTFWPSPQDYNEAIQNPAVMQLRIMNEADIRAVRKQEALWTDEVRQELDHNATALAYGAQRLSENTVPVLTAELPQRFGVYEMPKEGSLMVHTSPYMQNGTFFRHLSLIESPHYSGSASLVNRQHMHLYDSKADFTAVFAAPPEHVSQAHRTGLWTGESMGWNSHVIMAREWSKSELASNFAAEANAKLQKLGFGQDAGSQTALQSYRSQLAKYDTVTEMLAANGKDSPLARAHEAITEMYTKYEDGRPTGVYNEFKINNPAVAGIGVMSRGRQVVLEDPYGPALPENPNVLVIPKHMWQEAQSRNLPFIVLDAR
jgi:hypothetical protein